jgi:hypothetical protein
MLGLTNHLHSPSNVHEDVCNFNHVPHSVFDRQSKLSPDLTDVNPTPIFVRVLPLGHGWSVRLWCHTRFRSVTTPPLTRTNSFGAIVNTSFHVPAAAHTSSYCNKSGLTNTRS